MNQALHIFKKDVGYLRYDIGVTLLITAVFTVAASHNMPGLGLFLPVVSWFLIGRVVHGESLVGRRQFWVTRPYEWKSLLASKILFIAAFVNLPLFVADAIILQSAGFSVLHEWAGLIGTQVLFTLAILLPAAVFAALTRGIAELMFVTTLLLLAGVMAVMASSLWFHWGTPWFELEWVRGFCVISELGIAAAVILVWQYARRKTAATRLTAFGAAAVMIASVALLPWKEAFAVETQMARAKQVPAIQIQFDTERKWLGRVYPAEQNLIIAELPMALRGIAANMEFRPNGLSVTLRAPGGETARWQEDPQNGFNFDAEILSARAGMPQEFYEKYKDQPLQLRGTLFFTLYGNERGREIPLDGRPVTVPEIGVCSGLAQFLRCDSAFRVPAALATLRIWHKGPLGLEVTKLDPFPRTSFSPFPAELSIDPLCHFVWPSPNLTTRARIDVRQPLAHLEQNFEFDNVRLADFVKSR
jgi:hypothetical protein